MEKNVAVNTEPTVDELSARIIQATAVMLKRDPATITPDTRFFEELDFDSTSILDLLMVLESELGAEFDPETLEPDDFASVRSLAAYVAGRLPE